MQFSMSDLPLSKYDALARLGKLPGLHAVEIYAAGKIAPVELHSVNSRVPTLVHKN